MKTVQRDADTMLATAFVMSLGLVFLVCIGIVATALLLIGG